MAESKMAPFVRLANEFAAGRMSALAFESRFLAEFKGTSLGEDDYLLLRELFWAVEEFCADPALRDTGDLDEEGLREQVRVFMHRVREKE